MNIEKIKKDDGKLTKHISLIHCSNEVSLLQRKIGNVLLYNAYPFLQTKEEHTIAIKELCYYLGYRGHNYEAIKTALKGLITTVLEWNVLNDSIQGEDWGASSMLAGVNIKNAVCTYSYSPQMTKLIYSPAIYGKIDLSIQSKFTSSYGLALYENCSRYRRLGKTKIFSIENFRKILGVSDKKYLSFNSFKARVLNVAIDEVNLLSDLFVNAKLYTNGKQVTSLQFDIVDRKNRNSVTVHSCEKSHNRLSENKDKVDLALLRKMKNQYSLSARAINDIISLYGTSKIRDKTNLIECSQPFINGTIKNLSGLLIDALKKDYCPNKSSGAGSTVENMKAPKTGKVQKLTKLSVGKHYEQVNEAPRDILSKISDDKLVELLGSFEDYLRDLDNTFTLNMLKEKGLRSVFVEKSFKAFLEKKSSKVIL